MRSLLLSRGNRSRWEHHSEPSGAASFPWLQQNRLQSLSRTWNITTSSFITRFPECSKNPSNPFCTKQCIFTTHKNTCSSPVRLTKNTVSNIQHRTWAYLAAQQPWEILLPFPVRWYFSSSFGKGKMFTPWPDTNFPKNYEVKLPSLWLRLWDCTSFQTFPTNHHSSHWAFATLSPPTNEQYQPKNDSKRRTGGVTAARGLFRHIPEVRTCRTRHHQTGPTDRSKTSTEVPKSTSENKVSPQNTQSKLPQSMWWNNTDEHQPQADFSWKPRYSSPSDICKSFSSSTQTNLEGPFRMNGSWDLFCTVLPQSARCYKHWVLTHYFYDFLVSFSFASV